MTNDFISWCIEPSQPQRIISGLDGQWKHVHHRHIIIMDWYAPQELIDTGSWYRVGQFTQKIDQWAHRPQGVYQILLWKCLLTLTLPIYIYIYFFFFFFFKPFGATGVALSAGVDRSELGKHGLFPVQPQRVLLGWSIIDVLIVWLLSFNSGRNFRIHSALSNNIFFPHQARRLERQDPDLMQRPSTPIITHSTLPVWKRAEFPEIKRQHPCRSEERNPDRGGKKGSHSWLHPWNLPLGEVDTCLYHWFSRRGNQEWRE